MNISKIWRNYKEVNQKHKVVHGLIGLVGIVAVGYFMTGGNLNNTNAASGPIEVYPGLSNNAYKSALYSVEVFDNTNWISSYTYQYGRTSKSLWHNGTTPTVSFTTFGTQGSVNVRISKLGGTISSISASPKSKNFPVQYSNGQALLTLNQKDKAWVIINGDDANPLFIFADAFKPAIPTNATYFGPGVRDIAPANNNHYLASDNEVIYLDGGAWVRGNINVRGKTNVTVMGPGILSGDLWTSEVVQAVPWPQTTDYTMVIGDWGGNNANVSDITIVASPSYNFFAGTRNVTNVKLLSPWYYSTDGFQAVNHVDQSFAFVGDNVFFPTWAGVGSDSVTVTNSFAGNTGNAIFNGGYWGNDANNYYTAFVNNIDIKTYNSDAWVIPYGAPLTPSLVEVWVDNYDSTKGYSNQTYQNIRIEGNLQAPLMQLKNLVYPWDPANNPNPPLGNSYNLIFKNITLEGTQKGLSEIKGWDTNNRFHNVAIENLKINGTLVTPTNFGSYFATNSYVSNLKFGPIPLPTATLTAQPSIITSGSSSTLSWSTSFGTSVSINNGIGTVGRTGSITVSPTTNTTYTLTATNIAGTTTASATVTISAGDTTPPVTTITSPANNSYVNKSTRVTIQATASDNVGVKKVEFYVTRTVEGVLRTTLLCTDTVAPYSCSAWVVPSAVNRVYTLQTKAYDAAGNVGLSPTVKVTSK